MSVTIKDVARAAGVSPATVSRALSAPHMVSAETRENVLAVARDLGYRPNAAARGLITGRTGNLGLVVPDLENPFFASVTKGVQERARLAGYAVFVADSNEDAAQEAELVRSLAKQVDGLVLASPRAPSEEVESLAAQATVVLVNREVGAIPAVTLADPEGVRMALDHLRALGHRKIAYVGGPADSWSDGQRRGAVRAAGPDCPDTEFLELGSFSPHHSGGIAAADLAIASGATAVLAYNDQVALGLLSRLRQRGVRVPEEISLVGFDDILAAALVTPAITTVQLPLVAAGRAAVDLLLGLVDPALQRPVATRRLPVQLVVRDSTAVPPGRP